MPQLEALPRLPDVVGDRGKSPENQEIHETSLRLTDGAGDCCASSKVIPQKSGSTLTASSPDRTPKKSTWGPQWNDLPDFDAEYSDSQRALHGGVQKSRSGDKPRPSTRSPSLPSEAGDRPGFSRSMSKKSMQSMASSVLSWAPTGRQSVRYATQRSMREIFSFMAATPEGATNKRKGWSWHKCSATSRDYELRDLNFKELAQNRYGEACRWQDLSHDDQITLIRDALRRRTILIDPTSEYMKAWDIVVVLCLVFTAIVTPYEIAFLSSSGYDFLYFLNHSIDVAFVKDIVMQFFIKVKRQTKQGTVWVTDRKLITQIYLKSWFFIDMLSIVPYDDISTHLVHGGNAALAKLKIMRLLRALRLFKLVRIVKASRVFKRWENRLSLRYSSKSLLKFTILITVSCHWMACVWGFCGLLETGNLICREALRATDPEDSRLTLYPDRTYFFLNDDSVEPYSPSKWAGESWIVRFAGSRSAQTPTDPCQPEVLYLASVYWAVMTMTSIGYGDIVPITVVEYAVCSLCMMMSSIVWAYIIGAACATMSTMDPETSDFERRLDSFNAMSKDLSLPQQIRCRGREYLREERHHQHYIRNLDAVHSLGDELTSVVYQLISAHMLETIWFFQPCSPTMRQDVASRLLPHFYEKRVLISQLGQLCVVERGAVGRGGRILVPGSYWGEDMLLRDKHLWSKQASVSLSFSEIMTLSRDHLSDVLVNHPHDILFIRRAAATVELARSAHVYWESKEDHISDAKYERIYKLFDGVKQMRKSKLQGSPRAGKDTPSDMRGSDKHQRPLGEPKQTYDDQLRGIEAMIQRLNTSKENSCERVRNIEERQVDMQDQLSRIERYLQVLAEGGGQNTERQNTRRRNTVTGSTKAPNSDLQEPPTLNGNGVAARHGDSVEP